MARSPQPKSKRTAQERREVREFYAKNLGKIPGTRLASSANPTGKQSARTKALRGTGAPRQSITPVRVLVQGGIPTGIAGAKILSRGSFAESNSTAEVALTPSSGARQNQTPSDPGDTAAVDRDNRK